jgi:hypothetical protein
VRGARGELVIADHDAKVDVGVLHGLVKFAEVINVAAYAKSIGISSSRL